MAGNLVAGQVTADTWKNSDGTENYKCRAWVNFNGTGTVAIRASGNVSSITDNGVGDYTLNFATALPDSNYVTLPAQGDNTGGSSTPYQPSFSLGSYNKTITITTSSVRLYSVNSVGGTYDAVFNHVAVFR